MILAAATTISVDIPTAVAIGSALFGGCLVLLRIIRAPDIKRLADLETQSEAMKLSINDFVRQMAAIEHSTEGIDAIKDSVSKFEGELAVAVNSIENLDEKEKAFGKIVEKMREDLADARETIMGFGQDFVTRREWREAVKPAPQPVHMVIQPSSTPLPMAPPPPPEAPPPPPAVAPGPEADTDSQQEPE